MDALSQSMDNLLMGKHIPNNKAQSSSKELDFENFIRLVLSHQMVVHLQNVILNFIFYYKFPNKNLKILNQRIYNFYQYLHCQYKPIISFRYQSMGYNSHCYYQNCAYNCCNYYRYCPESPAAYYGYFYDSRWSSCYYYYYNTVAGGAIAGYVIAGVFVFVMLVIALVCYIRRKRAMEEQTIATNPNGQTIVVDNSYSQPYPPATMTYGPSYGYSQPTYGQPQPYQPAYLNQGYVQPPAYGQPAYGQAYPQQQGPIIIQRT